MKRTLLTFTVSPSFSGEIFLQLFEEKRRDSSSFILSYRKSVPPLAPLEELINKDNLSETWEREVSFLKVEEILESLKKANISPLPSYALGLDGTSYTLSVINGMNEVRFSWWHEVPNEWTALVGISDKLLQMAEDIAAGRFV
jgi:hypothetical protein